MGHIKVKDEERKPIRICEASFVVRPSSVYTAALYEKTRHLSSMIRAFAMAVATMGARGTKPSRPFFLVLVVRPGALWAPPQPHLKSDVATAMRVFVRNNGGYRANALQTATTGALVPGMK